MKPERRKKTILTQSEVEGWGLGVRGWGLENGEGQALCLSLGRFLYFVTTPGARKTE